MVMPNSLALNIQPNSGLVDWNEQPIPWAFEGKMNLALGGDGVAWSEVMQINWGNLQSTVQALLGYSYRDPYSLSVPQLRRKLPWQHPYFNQLWVKNVVAVEGIRMVGTNQSDPDDDFSTDGGGVGSGVPINYGPWTEFERARLTVQFWRPPYFVRSDADIIDTTVGSPYFGRQQEWLRYVDKDWSSNIQILSREGSEFVWSGGYVTGLPGTVGQAVTHQRVTRTWYEIPEAAIFSEGQDATPNGQADWLLYSQVAVTNPITGYQYATGYPISMALNVPIGGGVVSLEGTTTSASAVVTMASTTGLSVGDAVTGTGIRSGSTINSLVANTSITMSVAASASGTVTLTFVTDSDSSLRLFGCHNGVLRYDFAEVIPRPLQLPPYLMQVPLFANNEAISQVQYDVKFHFDIFDPPRGASAGAIRGHNLRPWSGNGLWYPVNSQKGADGTTNPPFLTQHPYADLSQLFQIL